MSRTQGGRWHILGAGSIGTALAFRLAEAGIGCTLLSHRGRERRILRIGERSHELVAHPLTAQASGSIARLLVTTKAGQIEAALRAALPFLARDATLLTTANGLGFARDYGTPPCTWRLERAVSTAGAYRETQQRVVLAARGETRVGTGAANQTPAPWFADSLARLVDWTWDSHVDEAVHRKFAINCVINPLSAVRGCRNGELIERDEARTQLTELCTEVEGALRRNGLWPSGDSLLDDVLRVCAATAANRSSMLQDVDARRTTEIDYLTGELLRRNPGLRLPLSEHLYRRLRS